MLFVWEGAVATLPGGRAVRAMERVDRLSRRWDSAVARWEVHDLALRAMWQIWERSMMRLDLVVTTREHGFTQAVARVVTEQNWPISYVMCEAADVLGRKLPSMAEVDTVYFGLEEQRWSYGVKGKLFDPAGGQII